MKKIVFYTGAGMSRESGLPTFRGKDGLWDSIDADAVASVRAWYCGSRPDCARRRQRVLNFFNPIRRQILEARPNEGHKLIAYLEDKYDVTVITQNGDDLHERAGSSRVLHLHGEALKNASTLHPRSWYGIDRENPDIHIGDKAPDGSQLRPYVIFFGEDIDMGIWRQAVEATAEAGCFVVIGSTMLVHPASELLDKVPLSCPLYVVDPEDIALPDTCRHGHIHLKCGAEEGMRRIISLTENGTI